MVAVGFAFFPFDVVLLVELLVAAVLFVAVFVLALVQTFQTSLDPESKERSRGLDGFSVVAAVVLFVLSWRIMGKEFRPQSFDVYWTGLLYWLPLALSLTAISLAGVRHLEVRWSQKRRRLGRILAWGVPVGLWLLTWGSLFLWASASSHF